MGTIILVVTAGLVLFGGYDQVERVQVAIIAFLAVNPGSLLATKMVRDAFGVAGADVGIGAEILCRAALDDDFDRSGHYFDNDTGRFASPHPDALDDGKVEEVIQAIEAVLVRGQPNP